MNTIEKQKLQKEAIELMQKFAKSLEKVKFKEKKTSKKIGGFREESQTNSTDEQLKKIMFENAPEKNKDFIIAEKKKW